MCQNINKNWLYRITYIWTVVWKWKKLKFFSKKFRNIVSDYQGRTALQFYRKISSRIPRFGRGSYLSLNSEGCAFPRFPCGSNCNFFCLFLFPFCPFPGHGLTLPPFVCGINLRKSSNRGNVSRFLQKSTTHSKWNYVCVAFCI